MYIVQANRQHILKYLPAEPKPGDELAQIRFKLPDGSYLERRFAETDTLQVNKYILDLEHLT